MVPDVYEIFELLEFHHILDVYDSVDEAINKFEVLESSGQSVAKEITLSKPKPKPAPAEEIEELPAVETMEAPAEMTEEQTEEPVVKPILEMSLWEKIQKIIQDNPGYGAYKIKKELNSAKYGFIRIGWLTVRSELGKMGLKSKSRRYSYATRSLK